jgi:hypothetical protein
MTSRWRAEGKQYGRTWAGRRWTLAVDGTLPGLRCDESAIGPVLFLNGISAAGRGDPSALGGASLIAHEVMFDRVEAAYAPADWNSLRVRATWTPRGDDVVDLEVQAQAFTVGDLEAVEIHVGTLLMGSVLNELPDLDPASVERLRDAHSTLPLPGDASFPSVLAELNEEAIGPRYYLEMIHPDGAIRREIDTTVRGVRYALFGHDLERGVIVRGRLRGIWYASRPDAAEVARRRDEFLREPPPLGT